MDGTMNSHPTYPVSSTKRGCAAHHRFAVRVPPPSGVGRTSKNNPTPELFSWKRSLNHDGVWLHITEGGMDGSVQQACMDSLFGGAKSEPTGEWTEIDLNGISRWQKQDDGAADIIWKSADWLKGQSNERHEIEDSGTRCRH